MESLHSDEDVDESHCSSSYSSSSVVPPNPPQPHVSHTLLPQAPKLSEQEQELRRLNAQLDRQKEVALRAVEVNLRSATLATDAMFKGGQHSEVKATSSSTSTSATTSSPQPTVVQGRRQPRSKGTVVQPKGRPGNHSSDPTVPLGATTTSSTASPVVADTAAAATSSVRAAALEEQLRGVVVALAESQQLASALQAENATLRAEQDKLAKANEVLTAAVHEGRQEEEFVKALEVVSDPAAPASSSSAPL